MKKILFVMLTAFFVFGAGAAVAAACSGPRELYRRELFWQSDLSRCGRRRDLQWPGSRLRAGNVQSELSRCGRRRDLQRPGPRLGARWAPPTTPSALTRTATGSATVRTPTTSPATATATASDLP